MLGKPAPAFKFVDLDGKPVTPNRWPARWPCSIFGPLGASRAGRACPNWRRCASSSRTTPRWRSTPSASIGRRSENKELVKMFEDLKVDIPILRDPERSAAAFKFSPFPPCSSSTSKGVVQDFEEGFNPKARRRAAGEARKAAGRREHLRRAVERSIRIRSTNSDSMRRKGRRPRQPSRRAAAPLERPPPARKRSRFPKSRRRRRASRPPSSSRRCGNATR